MSDHQWTVDENGDILAPGRAFRMGLVNIAGSSFPEWRAATAHRVATALNGRPDLTALAQVVAAYDELLDEFMAEGADAEVERVVALLTPLPRAKDAVIDIARALVASTGTETDDAQ